MAQMPGMRDTGQYRQGPMGFGGYNHNLWADGRDLYDAANLSLRHLPVLTSREARGRVRAFKKFNGMTSLNGLIWVDGTGLYAGGELVGQVADSFKRFAVMGSRVVIFPDKKVYDTAAGTMSDLEARAEGRAIFTLSRLDGEDYPACASGDAPPSAPANGQYWLDTSGENDALRVYAADSGTWAPVVATYVKIYLSGLGAAFRQYDGVRISGVENLAPTSEASGRYSLGTRGSLGTRLWNNVNISGSVDNASDRRLKREIADLEAAALLDELRPRRFKMKAEGETAKWRWGFIAQEAAQALAALGLEGAQLLDEDDPESLGLCYMELIAVLVEGYQRQKARLNEMEARLARLEARWGEKDD